MEEVGWLSILIVTSLVVFVFGYWFGYKCGQQDAEAGVKEP